MPLDDIVKNIKQIFSLENQKPFALALVGSRATGYYNSKSDYDFNAVFEKDFGKNYLNFDFDFDKISVKIQSRSKFENSMIGCITSSEQSRFSILPYCAIENKEYLESIEKKSRKSIIENFVRSLPQGKEVLVSIDSLIEWPLIERALVTPDYTGRLRRISNSNIDIKGIMGPKYTRDLKEMGYFINKKGEFVVKNESQERLKFSYIDGIKDRYDLAKKLDLDFLNFAKGSFVVTLQLFYDLFNSFDNFPKLKKFEGNFILNNPSIAEFLNKRRMFVPLEKITKKMKDNILISLTKKTQLSSSL